MEALLSNDDPNEQLSRRAIARWLTDFRDHADSLRAEYEAREAERNADAMGQSGTPYMEADSGSVDVEVGPL